MITNFNSNKKKDDAKILVGLFLFVLFVVWLNIPPKNKYAMLCYVSNNAQYFIAKMIDSSAVNEWVLHRNNAIYLALMGNKKDSLREMDRAFVTMPSYISENRLSSLYKDRAMLKIYYKDYKGALNDYTMVDSRLELMDRFKIALLYKLNGNNKYALSYCNSIIDTDPSAYAGYACVADVYGSAGQPEASIRIYDLLIDRFPNRAVYYVDRAKYKQKIGDMEGYGQDLSKAKQIAPGVNVNRTSIIEDTMSPRKLTLQIIKS